jgi:hypothetical protein
MIRGVWVSKSSQWMLPVYVRTVSAWTKRRFLECQSRWLGWTLRRCTVVATCSNCFNLSRPCIFPTQHNVCVCHVGRIPNGSYFPEQQQTVGLCDADATFIVRPESVFQTSFKLCAPVQSCTVNSIVQRPTDKVIVAGLIDKFSTVYETRRFNTVFTKAGYFFVS